jgi:chromosomal replication initiator protein
MDNPKIAQDVWNQCLDIIKEDIKEQTYNTWFKPVIPLDIIDQRLVIQVPSQFFYEWIEGHYNALVNKSIKTILGQDAKLVYKVEITDDESDKQISLALSENRNIPAKSVSVKNELPRVVDSNLKSQYTFDTFITGDNNQLARAAALNIAANPGGTSFNPIVIYGNVGPGKTHLIQAIGNEVLKRFNNKRVMYTSSEKFTVDFVDSLAENRTNEFSNFYKSMDVLIVDDIQFFAGKEKTQDIFSHTFNTLHQHNKQIVLQVTGLQET